MAPETLADLTTSTETFLAAAHMTDEQQDALLSLFQRDMAALPVLTAQREALLTRVRATFAALQARRSALELQAPDGATDPVAVAVRHAEWDQLTAQIGAMIGAD